MNGIRWVITALVALAVVAGVSIYDGAPALTGADAAAPRDLAEPATTAPIVAPVRPMRRGDELAPTAPPISTPTPTEEPLAVGAASLPSPTPASSGLEATYVVQPGDTLGEIARRYGVALDALVALNRIEDANLIEVGQELRIPDTAGPLGSPPAPAVVEPIQDEASAAKVDDLPDRVLLGPMSHEWQRMNNCAPATVAMALSFFGETLTQYDLAPVLKGGEQDKNVSPGEIVAYLRSIGYGARVQVNGDVETLQRLVASGVPVIVEQWLERPDDELTGHYRLVRGYDRQWGVFIVNDSYNGPELAIDLATFDRWWRAFNRLYIPIFRPEDEARVRGVLGQAWDEGTMYRLAAEAARAEVDTIGDLYAWFNLGDSLLGLDQPEEAVVAFEQAIALGLPPRMLWYRFGPFEALNRAGHYERVLELADPALAVVPMLEELQYQRGVALEGLGRFHEAIAAYELALHYHPGMEAAHSALQRLR